MTTTKRHGPDYDDPDVREEILVRQRRDMWTPEQVASLTSHLRIAPGTAMLDVGCGYGYCMRTWGPACLPGGRLVGVDREPVHLAGAARLAREEGLADAVELVEGDVLALPFDDDAFDVVMASVVLCHLDEPERALDEMIRVARPGGCIAVIDNAVGGCPWGWNSTERPSLPVAARWAEIDLRAAAGRRRLGRGDWAVGLHAAAWMEARGLRDVDARVNERVNERVHWIAPPYRSPGQQQDVRNARERTGDDGFLRMRLRDTAAALRATGADEALVRSAVRGIRERTKRWNSALDDGTAAYAFGGALWISWGFKP